MPPSDDPNTPQTEVPLYPVQGDGQPSGEPEPSAPRAKKSAPDREITQSSPHQPEQFAADLPQGLVQRKAPPCYLLEDELAQEEMGVIFRGRDKSLDRELAIKIMKPELSDHPELVDRFQNEARICGQLQHPGIVPVYELGRLPDGRPYFTMKLVQGQDLDALLAKRSSPSAELPRWLSVFEQIAQAIGYAHRRGVIHRDLKPANIKVGRFGEVQVMDWGRAKVFSSREEESVQMTTTTACVRLPAQAEGNHRETQAGSAVSTFAYMAPEQATGRVAEVDAQSDVFGLGGILCHILTGEAVYRGGFRSVQEKAQRSEVDEAFLRLDACGADPDLVALARCCLSPRKAERLADGAAVAEAVATYQMQVQILLQQERRERARQTAQAGEQRRRLRRQLSLAGVLLIGIFLASWWSSEVRQAAAHERQWADHQAFPQLDQEFRDNPAWHKPVAFAALQARLLPDGASDLRERLAQAARLWASVERLDRIRQASKVLSEHGFDFHTQVQNYQEAFQILGLDLDRGNLTALAQQIQVSPIRPHLVAALDDWASAWYRLGNPKQADRIVALAWAVAPSIELRNPRLWSDPTQIVAWQQQANQANWSPSLVLLVAHGIHDSKRKQNWLDAAYRRHPDWFDLAFQLGEMAYRDQRLDQAVGYYQAALALRPHHYVVWNNLGVIRSEQGDLDAAIAAFRTAIRLEPEHAETFNNLGNALNGQGKPLDAAKAFRRAIRLNPQLAVAHTNLGRTLIDQGDADSALPFCQTAVRLQPELVHAHTNLGIALHQTGQPRAALAAFHQAIELQGGAKDLRHRVDVYYWLGIALQREGKHREAIDAWQNVVQLQPKHADAYTNLGAAFDGQDQLTAAEAAYRQVIRLTPKDANAHFNLGTNLLKQGKLTTAMDQLRRAIDLAPSFAHAHLNLGIALCRRQEHTAAIEAFRQAIYLRPQDAAAYLQLGLVLHSKGELDDALEAYQTAIRLQPDDGEAHYQLGQILLLKGDLTEAMAALKRGHQLGSARPNWPHPSARKVRQVAHLVHLQSRWNELCRQTQTPTNGLECLELAKWGLEYGQDPRSAVLLYRIALQQAPVLAKKQRTQAASAALQAAQVQADHEIGPDLNSWYRRQALSWLQADLARVRDLIAQGAATTLIQAQQILAHWQTDPDVQTMRSIWALAVLPTEEQKAWLGFWREAQNWYVLLAAV